MLVLTTDVDVALRVSRSVAEAGLDVRATTVNADVIEMAHLGGFGRALDDAAWATLEDLDDALDHGRLRVAYQPIIDGRDGSLYAVEALARWRGPYGVPVAPDDFVTLAEMSGRIDQLTEAIFTQAVTWFGRHFATTDTKLCLNLSARSLVERRLPRWLGRLCESVDVAPSRLLLEVTETSVVGDTAGAERVLVELSEAGFEVALDDFGAGTASLLQLARYPFAMLKVDRQLVTATSHSAKVAAILVGILALARELDLTVVAEGIEDDVTERRLADMGFTLMQGNAIAPAMEPQILLSWLASRPGS